MSRDLTQQSHTGTAVLQREWRRAQTTLGGFVKLYGYSSQT